MTAEDIADSCERCSGTDRRELGARDPGTTRTGACCIEGGLIAALGLERRCDVNGDSHGTTGSCSTAPSTPAVTETLNEQIARVATGSSGA